MPGIDRIDSHNPGNKNLEIEGKVRGVKFKRDLRVSFSQRE